MVKVKNDCQVYFGGVTSRLLKGTVYESNSPLVKENLHLFEQVEVIKEVTEVVKVQEIQTPIEEKIVEIESNELLIEEPISEVEVEMTPKKKIKRN